MEPKVKEFCAFDCIELLFFNALFQNKLFKKIYFAESKVKVNVKRSFNLSHVTKGVHKHLQEVAKIVFSW